MKRILLGIMLFLGAAALLGQPSFARTYVITDGDRVLTHTTFATDPGTVLTEAGLELSREDRFTTEAGSITVSRAPRVTLHWRGQTMHLTAWEETLGQLLNRLELVPESEDVLSHSLDAPLSDGMEVRIDRVVTREEVYTRTIPQDRREVLDPTLPPGLRQVLQPGQAGELRCTAQVTYVNGRETARQVLSQYQTRPAVETLVALGTGEPQEETALTIADGYITLPTGEVLTYTGTATIRATAYTHTDAGCDRITATGTTVHMGTVAVDPRYIPYGTRMFIVSNDGAYVYGISVAEDCGGAIKGDRMDLYFPTYAECIQFGRRVCTIYFLG